MSSLFISYSRKDIEAAHKLTVAFKGQDLDFWIDWESIPPTVEWWEEIKKGIEEANIYLFLLSPDSAASKVCRQEIEHAKQNGKRLIPVVVRDVRADETPAKLSALNWIFLRESDNFDTGFGKLMTAIKTDYEWVEAHRDLQVKALEWERGAHDNSFLLRGKELQDAELQLARNSSKEPYPTELQREYALKSRQVGDRQRRITTSIATAGIIALAILAFLAQRNAVEANYQAATAQAASRLSRSREFAALVPSLLDEHVDLSLLLSVESFEYVDTGAARKSLLSGLLASPHLYSSAPLTAIRFSPDGTILSSGDQYGTVMLWDVSNRVGPRQLGQPLNGSVYNITSMAFQPDNKFLAAGDADGSIILWDVSNPTDSQLIISARPTAAPSPDQPISKLGQVGPIRGLEFSPNGKILVSSNASEVVLWNLGDPVNPAKFSTPIANQTGTQIYKIALSPDGKFLATTQCTQEISTNICNQSQLVLRDVSNPTQPKLIGSQPIGQLGADSQIAFNSKSNAIYFTSCQQVDDLNMCSENEILAWDFTKSSLANQFNARLEGINSSFYNLSFNKADGTLISIECGQIDFTSKICTQSQLSEWDPTYLSQPLKSRFFLSSQADSLFGISPDARTAVYTNNDIIALWQIGLPLQATHPLRSISGDSFFDLRDVVFSPNGKNLAASSYSETVLWDVSDQSKMIQSEIQINGTSPIFSSDSDTIVTTDFCSGTDEQGNCTSQSLIWEIKDISAPSRMGFPLSGSAYAFGPTGTTLFTLANQGDVFWDISQLTEPKEIGKPIPRDKYCPPTLSPDGKTLALVDSFDRISIWDISDPATPSPLGGSIPNGQGCPTLFSPNGKLLASPNDGGIFLWDVSNPSLPESFGELSGHRPFTGVIGTVSGFIFSPDNRVLITAGWDGLIILWDTASPGAPKQFGTPLKVTTDFGKMPLALTSDGALFAVANGNKISLWDIRDPSTPLLLGELPAPNNDPESLGTVSLAFSPNSKILASGDADGTIILWDVDPDSWVKRACERAGRNFTQAEWAQYFPNEDYRKTCDQWPLRPEATPTP